MLSIGFPNDEDEGLQDGPICPTCLHEMSLDGVDLDSAEWYCAECQPKKEEAE